MSSQRIFTNVELAEVLNFIVARYATTPGAVLRLFRNDFDPTPASVTADFMECNWDNYLDKLLLGELPAAAKVEDGHYESVSDPFPFFPPTTGSGNMVYGAYVTFDGITRAAERFAAPLPMVIGSPAFSVRLRLSSKSESLFLVE